MGAAMTDRTIKLKPDLFMALGLSAEAACGVGRGRLNDGDKPLCIVGHALDLGVMLPKNGHRRWGLINDRRLERIGLDEDKRVPFARWCEVVGVDVAE
jgi:hypothetical protein